MSTKIKYIVSSLIIFNFLLSCGNGETLFYNIEIPEELNFDKPIEYLNDKQKDSIRNLKVDTEKILVIGNGYNGYDFYMWHKPKEMGKIYIKAFELTQNIQLSEWKLSNRTSNQINEKKDSYILYRGNTVIDEGTFEKYYPVRFELWFASDTNETELKLAEKYYVIDGWDR